MTISFSHSLKPHHTFGMDVYAERFVEYDSVADLRETLAILHERWPGEPMLHIGAGSNLLFGCTLYRGTILHSAIKGIILLHEDDESVSIRVGSGVVWDDLVAYCVSQGWGGMENLSHIPGEVGASAVQNIGAYGMEAKDLIENVETLDTATMQQCRFANAECRYAYRHSIFKEEGMRGRHIVTHVEYRLQKHPELYLDYGNIRKELEGVTPTLETVRQAVIRIRESKLPDPKVCGNAGSFFMNPIVSRSLMETIREDYPGMPYYEVDDERVKIPAGWMIEQCGWKGRSMGNAAVHDKQALVLVNKGEATGQEVWALSQAVRQAVKEKFGIDIRPEVNLIN